MVCIGLYSIQIWLIPRSQTGTQIMSQLATWKTIYVCWPLVCLGSSTLMLGYKIRGQAICIMSLTRNIELMPIEYLLPSHVKNIELYHLHPFAIFFRNICQCWKPPKSICCPSHQDILPKKLGKGQGKDIDQGHLPTRLTWTRLSKANKLQQNLGANLVEPGKPRQFDRQEFNYYVSLIIMLHFTKQFLV